MIDQNIYVFQYGLLALALVLGLILVFVRPYWAFLFAILISISLSQTTVTYTRTEELGAFFNLYDACLIVAFLAFIADKKASLVLPKPALALLIVLVIGFCNSLVSLGFSYGVVRALRWAINLPIFFILAASLVRGESRIKALLLTLILGALAAELQHLFMVFLFKGAVDNLDLLRTIKFYVGGSDAWLLAGPYLDAGRILHPLIQLGIGGLFLLANLTHQTRSVALGFMGGLLVYGLWFINGPNCFRWQRLKGFFSVVLVGAFLVIIAGASGMVQNYAARLVGTVEKNNPEGPTQDRVNALKLEMNDWINGNILIGNGLNYFESYGRKLAKFKRKGGIALGHLGYITYLSQLGLIGFLVYGFYFPWSVILRARRLMRLPGLPSTVTHLSALTGACFIYQSIVFLFSSSYLIIHIVPGLLAGAVWSVSENELEMSQAPAETDEAKAWP